MSLEQRERLGRDHRLHRGNDISAVKAGGTPFRGRYCVLLVLARPAEPTRFGFIASRKGVGGAVQRNRARRRLREIVRRRWARVPPNGWLLMFVAYRSTPTVPHADLVRDVERVMAAAGILAPAAPAES